MSGCICEGNWRALVAEYDPLIDRTYRDARGRLYTFFGLVHGSDDYYFGMRGETGTLRLLTCVGRLDDMGFTLVNR